MQSDINKTEKQSMNEMSKMKIWWIFKFKSSMKYFKALWCTAIQYILQTVKNYDFTILSMKKLWLSINFLNENITAFN